MSIFPETRTRSRAADVAICLAMLIAVFLAYSRVFGFGFLQYDDGDYVTENANLRLTALPDLLRWIFLSFDPDNWFPLTRLSLLLDYRLFGLDARGYHVENVLIHGVASLLLYWFLRSGGEFRWPAAFVAAVFALHPLHVESVAWVSERKDVLCALFWFATLCTWARYRSRGGTGHYVLCLGLAALSLMAKPMAVTLPVTLLLADLFPLRQRTSRRSVAALLPFVALSCLSAWLTIQAQIDHIPSRDVISLSLRLQNGAAAVALYVRDLFWPARLWAPYAWPRIHPGWLTGLSMTAVLTAITGAALSLRKQAWLTTGLLWFLLTLVPVIGLVHVGPQSRADRYMYVPMVGLLMVLAWGGRELIRARPALLGISAFAAVGICLSLAIRTYGQTTHWLDSSSLLEHALEMDPKNYLALNYKAQILPDYRSAEAEMLYRRALEIRPEDPSLHYNLAKLLCAGQRAAEGLAEFQEAVALDELDAQFRLEYAFYLAKDRREADAIAQLQAALRVKPDFIAAQLDLAWLLIQAGRSTEAVRHLDTAIRLNSRDAVEHVKTAQALDKLGGREDEAVLHFQRALQLDPEQAPAHLGLSAIYQRRGQSFEAAAHLQAARALGKR